MSIDLRIWLLRLVNFVVGKWLCPLTQGKLAYSTHKYSPNLSPAPPSLAMMTMTAMGEDISQTALLPTIGTKMKMALFLLRTHAAAAARLFFAVLNQDVTSAGRFHFGVRGPQTPPAAVIYIKGSPRRRQPPARYPRSRILVVEFLDIASPFCLVCGYGISSCSVLKYWLGNEKKEVLGCCNVQKFY